MESNYKRLGNYIREIDLRNTNSEYLNLMGVSINKQFIPSVANIIGTDLSKYKVISKNQFACSLMQVSRDGGIAISLYKDSNKAIMSPAYYIFEIIDDKQLMPEYLELIVYNPEFDREAVFNAIGGVRGTLTWEDFCDMKVNIPDITEQEKIVRQYKTITDRIGVLEKINEELENIASLVINNMYAEKECNHKIADYCEDMIGGDWGKEEENGNYKSFVTCIRGADIPYFNQGIITTAPKRYIISKNLISRKIKPGNLIIEMSGGTVTQATGRVACASEENLHGLDVICSNFCRLLKVKEGYEYIIFEIWKKLYREDVMFSYENGTSGLKNFEIDNFINEVDIYISDNATMINQQLKDIYAAVHRNGLEIETLSKLKRQIVSRL